MDIESIREYVLRKPSVTEGFPFGEEVLVFKVNDKMFLLLPLNTHPLQFNVKCEPELALEWREQFPQTVLPGYHMNKTHWNTVVINGNLSGKLIREMIDLSYDLVAKTKKKPIPKKKKN
ncbi:MAG: hypothetical protein RLY16_60 [Bacteroidota bacterium]